jgi:uncharacterized protein with von Willebrand factor type A (vWA) domain
VVPLDASGSMEVYSRYFLNFVRGLIGRWLRDPAGLPIFPSGIGN